MLAIKLRRIGKKRHPSYRVVVAEKKDRPQSPGIEDLGWMDPIHHTKLLKKERIEYWIKQGAQPTETVHNLLVSQGVISGAKIPVHKKAKASKEAATKPGVETKTASSEQKNP